MDYSENNVTNYILDKYLLVVEYAEGGTLRNYLEKNFLSLDWKDKYELAFQLSEAIGFLHEREIVHKDLHSSSILVQHNSIKLADSGLSKRIKDSSRTWLDIIPYIDPRGFDTEDMTSKEYELNEESDVYSVGILLWELSSGKKPFSDKEYDLSLAKEIAQGLREVIVEGTPERYSVLYSSKYSIIPLEVLNKPK
jgi:serine/threonine protein kinase